MCAIFSSLKSKVLNLETSFPRKEEEEEIVCYLVNRQAEFLRLGLANLDTMSEPEAFQFYTTLQAVVAKCSTCSAKLIELKVSGDSGMDQGLQEAGISPALLWLYFVYHHQHRPRPTFRDLTPRARLPSYVPRGPCGGMSLGSPIASDSCPSEVSPLCEPQNEGGSKTAFSSTQKSPETGSADSSIFDQPTEPTSSTSSLGAENTAASKSSHRTNLKNYIKKTFSTALKPTRDETHHSLSADIKIIRSFGLVRFIRRDPIVRFFRSLGAKNFLFSPAVYCRILQECQTQNITAHDLAVEIYDARFKQNADLVARNVAVHNNITTMPESKFVRNQVHIEAWFPERIGRVPGQLNPVPSALPPKSLAKGHRPPSALSFVVPGYKRRSSKIPYYIPVATRSGTAAILPKAKLPDSTVVAPPPTRRSLVSLYNRTVTLDHEVLRNVITHYDEVYNMNFEEIDDRRLCEFFAWLYTGINSDRAVKRALFSQNAQISQKGKTFEISDPIRETEEPGRFEMLESWEGSGTFEICEPVKSETSKKAKKLKKSRKNKKPKTVIHLKNNKKNEKNKNRRGRKSNKRFQKNVKSCNLDILLPAIDDFYFEKPVLDVREYPLNVDFGSLPSGVGAPTNTDITDVGAIAIITNVPIVPTETLSLVVAPSTTITTECDTAPVNHAEGLMQPSAPENISSFDDLINYVSLYIGTDATADDDAAAAAAEPEDLGALTPGYYGDDYGFAENDDLCKVTEPSPGVFCLEAQYEDVFSALVDLLSVSLDATTCVESDRIQRIEEASNTDDMCDPFLVEMGFSGSTAPSAGVRSAVVHSGHIGESTADAPVFGQDFISAYLSPIADSSTAAGIDTRTSAGRPSTESPVQVIVPQADEGFYHFFEEVKNQWSEVTPAYAEPTIVEKEDPEPKPHKYPKEFRLQRDEVHGPKISVIHNHEFDGRCVVDGSSFLVVCHHCESCNMRGPNSLASIVTGIEFKPIADFAYFILTAYPQIGFRFLEHNTHADLLLRCNQNKLYIIELQSLCIEWFAGLKETQTILIKELHLLKHLSTAQQLDMKQIKKNYFEFYQKMKWWSKDRGEYMLEKFLEDRRMLVREALRLVNMQELAMHEVYMENMAMLIDINELMPDDLFDNLFFAGLEHQIENRFDAIAAQNIDVDVTHASKTFMTAHGVSKYSVRQQQQVYSHFYELTGDFPERAFKRKGARAN